MTTQRASWKGRYTAISYVWGPEGDTQIVLVNGNKVQVRRNLFDYLSAWRWPRGPKILWVDALCIDQSNIGERGHQVKIMADIYRDAQKVWCWLGTAADDTDWLFHGILEHPQHDWLSRQLDLEHYGSLLYGSKLDSDRAVNSMRAVFERPYLSRIWCVQEMKVASNLHFVCGEHVCTSRTLINAYQLMADAQNAWRKRGLVWAQSFGSPVTSGVMEWLRARSSPQILVRAFRRHGHMGCSVMHDKIFAIIGLLTEKEQRIAAAVVDYNVSTAQLLVNVLQAFPTSDTISFTRDAIQYMHIDMDELNRDSLTHFNVRMKLRVSSTADFLIESLPFFTAFSAEAPDLVGSTMSFVHITFFHKLPVELALQHNVNNRMTAVGVTYGLRFGVSRHLTSKNLDHMMSMPFVVLTRLLKALFRDYSIDSRSNFSETDQIEVYASALSSGIICLATWEGLHQYAPLVLEGEPPCCRHNESEAEQYWNQNGLKRCELLRSYGWTEDMSWVIRAFQQPRTQHLDEDAALFGVAEIDSLGTRQQRRNWSIR